MPREDIMWLWLAAYVGTLFGFVARVAWLLGVKPDPPTDPVEAARWRRRRLWLVGSEFAALPLFATIAVIGTVEGWLSPVKGVLFALVSGALGFAFFLHALETVLRRKIGMAGDDRP
jgi:hypothetical protein